MNEERPPKKGKVTIRTVAEEAGVSVAAVSKVLRNAYGVSDALRDKVLESIDKLGYRPSTAARGMRGQTYTVGVLLIEMDNPFLPGVVNGAKQVLRQHNYQVMIGISDARRQIETTLIESMMDMRMDGLLIIAPQFSGRPLTRFGEQIPIVVAGHYANDSETFDTINSDDEEGARMAVRALVASGRRDIHMLSLPREHGDHGDVFHLREQGYLAAMAEAGLSDRARIRRASQRGGLLTSDLEAVIEGKDMPDAIFCWSDIHALPLLNMAKMRGIDVPGRLAIVGYDNTPAAAMPLVGLSSIDQDAGRLGALAGEMLLSRIGGRRAAEHVMIPPSLVARTSS